MADKKVFPRDYVDIVYTSQAKHHKEGDKASVHRVQAEKLRDKGFATIVGEDLPAEGGKKKKKSEEIE